MSQLKLLAVAAALTFLFLTTGARAQDSNVERAGVSFAKGTGLPRSERDCLMSLPAFKKRLNEMGYKLAAALKCEEVLGENDTFAPAFTVASPKPVAAVTTLGQIYPTRSSCEKTLDWLRAHAIDANEALLEGECLEVSVVDQNEDEMKGGQYQPMLILMRDKSRVPANAAAKAAPRSEVDCKFSSRGAECVARKR